MTLAKTLKPETPKPENAQLQGDLSSTRGQLATALASSASLQQRLGEEASARAGAEADASGRALEAAELRARLEALAAELEGERAARAREVAEERAGRADAEARLEVRGLPDSMTRAG